jgi:hypothetical protein
VSRFRSDCSHLVLQAISGLRQNATSRTSTRGPGYSNTLARLERISLCSSTEGRHSSEAGGCLMVVRCSLRSRCQDRRILLRTQEKLRGITDGLFQPASASPASSFSALATSWHCMHRTCTCSMPFRTARPRPALLLIDTPPHLTSLHMTTTLAGSGMGART